MTPLPSLTRRQFLDVSVASVTFGSVATTRDPIIESWTPTVGSWPTRRYGPRNTGHNPYSSVPTTEPSVVWEQETEHQVHSLVVDGGSVFYGVRADSSGYEGISPSFEGRVVSVDAETGDERWQVAEDGVGVAVHGGTVYTVGDAVTAFDTETGTQRWRNGSVAARGSKPYLIPAEGIIYLSGDGLSALDATTGNRRFRLDGVGGVSGNVAVGDDRLVVGGGGVVRGYGPRRAIGALLHPTPRVAWEQRPGDYTTTPTVVDNSVFIGAYGHRDADVPVARYDLETGERRWQSDRLGHWVASPTAVGDTVVYAVATNDDPEMRLVAVHRDTGAVQWRSPLTRRVSDPIASGGTVVVGTSHELLAVDTADGTVRWRRRFAETDPTPLAIADGRLYVATELRVYAFE